MITPSDPAVIVKVALYEACGPAFETNITGMPKAPPAFTVIGKVIVGKLKQLACAPLIVADVTETSMSLPFTKPTVATP
ncbi:MAG: hypothetical protein BWY95_02190 [Bacteroidetes bacterium ADurb.BinA104]|nr:MAG: hypothetical protein BWY95_02190 [Bacteroidetes bacterium ADurb.BinA104]